MSCWRLIKKEKKVLINKKILKEKKVLINKKILFLSCKENLNVLNHDFLSTWLFLNHSILSTWLFINQLFLNHNHNSYRNTKHTHRHLFIGKVTFSSNTLIPQFLFLFCKFWFFLYFKFFWKRVILMLII